MKEKCFQTFPEGGITRGGNMHGNKMLKCLVCGEALFSEPLMELENMPASAQDIPDMEEISSDAGITLRLCQCRGCGLVQLDCGPVSYFRDVIRSGGLSTTMVSLRRRQYSALVEKYRLKNRKIIEVGCGQGEFLSILKEFPVRAFGIEHKRELVFKAKNRGLSVAEGFVEDGAARIPGGPFDAFLSFNFLEHQPDPNGMLQGISSNLSGEGIGLVTVPSLEYILEQDSWYELIRDHLAYYTFDTLRFLMEKNGFEVLEQEVVNRDTLSVVVRKRRRQDGGRLSRNLARLCDEVNTYINYPGGGKKKTALWGASHQGFTLAAAAGLAEKVEYIIDSAPFKQGRYAPVSHIPILSPDEALSRPVDQIIIIAPGYTGEIAGIIREKFGTRVEIAAVTGERLQRYEDHKI